MQPKETLHKALWSGGILGIGHAIWHSLVVMALGIQANLHRQLRVCSLLCSAAKQRPVDGVKELSKDLRAKSTGQILLKLLLHRIISWRVMHDPVVLGTAVRGML